MNYFVFIVSLICLFYNATGADFTKELAELKSGKRQEARAEWWGYNPKRDNHSNLQSALNSGAKKLTISKQAGPWLLKSGLKLPSNMEIVFEDGAEIKAMRGYFKRIGDMLLVGKFSQNLVLRGKGILTMHKRDYQNPKEYRPSEHRHTLALFACKNIKISGLTLQKSGGDGIYVNNVTNLLIDNVVLDENHRQGISVINARNLLIKNSLIKNTNGTAPECGIDFEPNHGYESLINCRVENCIFENNACSAVNVSLSFRGDTNIPADITVENCVVKGGTYGFAAMLPKGADQPLNTLMGGNFIIRNCKVENTEGPAFYFASHRIDGKRIVIVEDSIVNNTISKAPPIFFIVRGPAVGSFGGLKITNTKINAPKAKKLLDYISLMPQCRLTEVSGTVIFNGRKVDLSKYIMVHGFDKDPVMFTADIPLSGFSPDSIKSVKRLSDSWYFKLAGTASDTWNKSYQDEYKKWATIRIGHWEKARCSSPALHKKLKSYDGTAWYVQEINIPKDWKGSKIYLYCGAIDESAEFFLNGKHVGTRLHDLPDNWLLPLAIKIDENINPSKEKQLLSIRVTDTKGGGGIWKPIWLISR